MKNKVTSISAQKASLRSRVPIKIKFGSAEFCTFENLVDEKEHVALVFGDPNAQESPMIRVHSECLTGDVFRSRRCDCGFQLDEALTQLSKHGGVLLYLRQEGRGIGLYEKLAAYDIQIADKKNTYEANLALGHGEDLRDFEVAAQMLNALNIQNVSLLSNNPDKARQLEKHGIIVTQTLPTKVFIHDDNKPYLEAKADSGRHVFMHHPRDIYYMQQALSLAQKGLGRTAPNPSVGCVIVKGDEIIGQARTADSGVPHAETEALKEAGDNAEGAEMFVTLEPCFHHGRTPPCVDAIIAAKIKRIVIATIDPYPQVNGRSVKKLQEAGIEVVTGVLEEEAQELNKGFFLRISESRPLVTLKIATTLDGKIASKSGHSKWITNEESRKKVHELRAKSDAILVGSGTYLTDNPDLSPRDVDYDGPEKLRVVLDRSDKVTVPEGFSTLSETNVSDVLSKLSEEGVTRLMVEGGGQVVSSFLESGLWDELYWFRAPKVLGDDGVPAFKNFDFNDISESFNLDLVSTERFGNDILEVWKKA